MILRALLESARRRVCSVRHAARALATLFWYAGGLPGRRRCSSKQDRRHGCVHAMFGPGDAQEGYIAELKARLDEFVAHAGCAASTREAAEYLFHELADDTDLPPAGRR